jgi:RHS repeat-associated protein
MKLKLLAVFTIFTNLIFCQSSEVGMTEGQLSVSLTGSATYNIPIATPPGINGVVPKVSLAYNSQGGNGMAGLGWNIAGVSSITRTPRNLINDNIVGGVNLDKDDRFALDGQYLVNRSVMSGAIYGNDGTIYETVNYSNLKITSVGVSPLGAKYGPAYFKVEYPDGSIAEYGSTTDSRSINSWNISYMQNPQGVRISYSYSNAFNNVNIVSIKYGNVGTGTFINEIKFEYTSRVRAEQAYLGGESIVNDKILDKISVIGNGVGFRSYSLTYDVNSLNYQRLKTITETSGDGTKNYRPITFSYENSSDSNFFELNPNTNMTLYATSSDASGLSAQNAGNLTSDFDNDGKNDVLLFPRIGNAAYKKYWIFKNINGNASNIGVALDPAYTFKNIVPVSFLKLENSNYKFNSNGWTIISELGNTTYFKTYYLKNDAESLVSTTSFVFPKADFYNCNQSIRGIAYSNIVGKKFLEGDFEGDGLTDILAIEDKVVSTSCSISNVQGYYSNNQGSQVYLINLNRGGSVTVTGVIPEGDYYIADFNGDGKSDIYVVADGKIEVFSITSNRLIKLVTFNDAGIKKLYPFLSGDYNADGKIDFVQPVAVGQDNWNFFMSTGTLFIKHLKPIGAPFNFSRQESRGFASESFVEYNYIPSDFNGDGKTDILFQENLTNATGCVQDQFNNKVCLGSNIGMPQVTNFKLFQNNLDVNGQITFSISGSKSIQQLIKRNAIPLFTNYNRLNLNLEYSLISDKKIYTFNSKKDNRVDGRLSSVVNGDVTELITYKPLIDKTNFDYQTPMSTYNATLGKSNYPNIDINAAPQFYVVSMLQNQSISASKKRTFAYAGATSNLNGLGFLGFRATMSTNWYSNNTPVVSSVSKFDPELRGANIENYTHLATVSPLSVALQSNSTATSFPAVTTPNQYGLLTGASLLKYERIYSPFPTYNIRNIQTKNFNTIEDTSSEINTIYDSFNNPTKVTETLKNGGVLEQTKEVIVSYTNNFSSTNYYIGRPINKKTTTIAYGDTWENKEAYLYGTGLKNNLPIQIQKWGNGITDPIIENNEFDDFGNIVKKTISASDISPRITNYQYDTTGRFLTEKTDIEGLKTFYGYNPNNGLVLNEIKQTELNSNFNRLTNTYEYDAWFKKIKTIDYLGKANTILYTRNGEKTTIASTGEDGSYSEEVFDELGRKITTGVKDIQGNMSYKDYQYDAINRNIKTSEPYSSGSPTQWSVTDFDGLGRPNKVTSYTGKIVTMSYDKLTTTVADNSTGQTKVSTKNSIGHQVKTIDTPVGGTINYTYFANGNLKQTDYDGTSIIITQDGWGRKTSLLDPSAGRYTYTYNTIGELLTETTPNGTTTNTYDNFGKVSEKTIVGTNTNSKTSYTYDANSKLLTNIKYEDLNNGGVYDEYTYVYDNYKRLHGTFENKFGSFFQRVTLFDAFGRPESEAYNTIAGGKQSPKWTRNTYKNGYHYQILDDATNKVLWQTDKVNERGQTTSAKMGNDIDITNKYDIYGYPTQFKHDLVNGATTTNLMTLNNVFEPTRGNLTSRYNSLFNKNETFQYDTLDRLTEYTNLQGIQAQQIYEQDGRIKENTLGKFNYTNTSKKYQNTSIDINPESKAYYENRLGVFNDSCEKNTGWRTYWDPIALSYDATVSRSGTKSLKINNTTTNEKIAICETWTKINNAVPTQYTYSAWVKSDGTNPQAELFLYMKTANETNVYTQYDQIQSTTTNGWTLIEKTFTVPANITKIQVRLGNNGIGVLWYDDISIRKTGNLQTSQRELNISYNTFKSPYEIEETGVDKIRFTYNYMNNRSVMYYGGLEADKYQRQYHKHYSADGSMEVKYNTKTNEVDFVTYIGGDAYTAPIVLKSDGTTQNYLYLHRDYQGSIVAISNEAGNIIEKRLYDAWGEVSRIVDGQGDIITAFTVLDRGYTGHEHLLSIGLVHMNGRLYDPKLHRFLQPDNYVQDPNNTQNFNRYGYCYNNPLKYTDPSGEWIHIVTGALIGGVVNWAINGFQFNAKGLAYFGVGAVAGALTAMGAGGVSSALAGGSFSAGALGTSAALTATSSFFTGAVIGASGGLVGGFVTGVGNGLLDGQNIGQALGSGVRDGLVGSLTGGGIGGIAGGIDAVRDGRRFWDGATVVKQTAVPPYTLQNLQQSSEASCQATCGATIDQSLGGSMTEMDVRNMMPSYDYTGVGAGDEPFWTEFATKTGRHLQSSAMTDDFSANFFNAFSINEGGVASTRIALSTSNHSLVLQSITKTDITKIGGRVITKYLLNVMDPAYGAIRSFRPSSFINYFLIR